MRRIDFSVFGNHSITYNGKEIADKEDVIKRLNSLKLEESEFVLEECKRGHTPEDYDAEKNGMLWKESLERDLKIHSWYMAHEFSNKNMPKNKYRFVGPFGLQVEITYHYIIVEHSAWRFKRTIKPFHTPIKRVEYNEWRNAWQPYFNQIIRVLGGNCALYNPDFEVRLFDYVPYGPDKKYDGLICTIFNEYPHCLIPQPETYSEDIMFIKGYPPFIVDRFEDTKQESLCPIPSTATTPK